jgi:hypothetical protein
MKPRERYKLEMLWAISSLGACLAYVSSVCLYFGGFDLLQTILLIVGLIIFIWAMKQEVR